MDELEREIARLDGLLAPIGKRPVDMNDPDWRAKLGQALPAVDEAGVRAETEAALARLVTAYGAGDEESRAHVRDLFNRYPSFRWAAPLAEPRDTAEDFRRQLLHWSAVDLGPDTRDALLWVWGICDQAKEAGVDIAGILAEVAAISSTIDRHGMGSAQQILLNCLSR